MWNCQKCGESIEEQFDTCWKCGTPKGVMPIDPVGNSDSVEASKTKWRLAYKYFRGTLSTWDQLFSEAAQFATEVGSDRVVGISHSADSGDGVVTVWYWTVADKTEGT